MTHKDLVRASRHKHELILLAVAGAISLILFAGFIIIAVYKNEVADFVESHLKDDISGISAEPKLWGAGETSVELSDEDKALVRDIRDLDPVLVALSPLALLIFITYLIASLRGSLEGNAIQVGPNQMPDVYELWSELADQLGMQQVPDLFVLNGNGALNAFASCVPGNRSFGCIYAEIVHTAQRNNDVSVLEFVLAHELGHIKLGHVRWWYIIIRSLANLPIIRYFVGLPLSRAGEYGCDKLAFNMTGRDDNCNALVMLAAGRHLYRSVNQCEYAHAGQTRSQFWTIIYNLTADHPPLYWRIAALRSRFHGQLMFGPKVQPKALRRQQ